MTSDPHSFSKFQATGLYLNTVQALVAMPELSGKQQVELLHFAYSIYARVRARQQIERQLNGDGGMSTGRDT